MYDRGLDRGGRPSRAGCRSCRGRCAGERGQVEELVVGAEDDLDLLDGAAVAGQPVVDAAPDEPPAELGERPVERARPRRSRPADAGTRPFRRQFLDARHAKRGAGAEMDLERAGENAWSPPAASTASVEPTSSSTTDASAPSPRSHDRAGEERATGRARRASGGRSAARGGRRPGRGGRRPGLQRPGSAGRTCRRPAAERPSPGARGRRAGSRAEDIGERSQDDAGGARDRVENAAPSTPSSVNSISPATPSGRVVAARRAGQVAVAIATADVEARRRAGRRTVV